MDASCSGGQSAVIEIVGPPGSGKSTLAEGLVDALRESGCAVRQSRHLQGSGFSIHSQLAAGVRTLSDVVKLWPYLYRSYAGGTALNDVRWAILLRRVLRHAYARRLGVATPPEQGLLILEPGWQMQLLNGYLFSHKPLSVAEAAQFLTVVPPSDLSVCLSVRADTAMARFEQRPRGLPQRMRQLDENQWQGVIERGNEATRILADQGRALGRAVLQLDVSSKSPEEVVRDVQDALPRLEPPSTAPTDTGSGHCLLMDTRDRASA
jgi:thymidylate kinase